MACVNLLHMKFFVNKLKMEEEIKVLQKHMAGLERTIRDLKAKVEAMERKDKANDNEESKAIFEKHIHGQNLCFKFGNQRDSRGTESDRRSSRGEF